MNKYCRYCAFCFEADDFRCSNHPKGKQLHMTRAQINRPNKCPNFALSELGDVETGKPYVPRTIRKVVKDSEQICIPAVLFIAFNNMGES